MQRDDLLLATVVSSFQSHILSCKIHGHHFSLLNNVRYTKLRDRFMMSLYHTVRSHS